MTDEEFLEDMDRYCSIETKRLCRMVRDRDSKIDTLRELCDAREFVRGELLKVAVDALSDEDNHWHATNEIPNATRPCTACEALARIKGDG